MSRLKFLKEGGMMSGEWDIAGKPLAIVMISTSLPTTSLNAGPLMEMKVLSREMATEGRAFRSFKSSGDS